MVDKNHADFAKYKAEFATLVKEEEKELSEIETPANHSQDGPKEIVKKRYHTKIKELQKKYKHLFI